MAQPGDRQEILGKLSIPCVAFCCSIHRSAWNSNSANFACTEFSEVRVRTVAAKITHLRDAPPLASCVKLPALANGAGVRNTLSSSAPLKKGWYL